VKRLKGFTLIELVIVIAILAILAAVAIPKFVDLSKKARMATAESEIGALRAAASLYYASLAVRGTPNFPGTTKQLLAYLQKGPTQLWCLTPKTLWGCDQIIGTTFMWKYNPTNGFIYKVGSTSGGWAW